MSSSTPSAIGIIASNFHGKARSTAFAAFSAGAPVGGGIGLVLGGVLTAYSPYVMSRKVCLRLRANDDQIYLESLSVDTGVIDVRHCRRCLLLCPS